MHAPCRGAIEEGRRCGVRDAGGRPRRPLQGRCAALWRWRRAAALPVLLLEEALLSSSAAGVPHSRVGKPRNAQQCACALGRTGGDGGERTAALPPRLASVRCRELD